MSYKAELVRNTRKYPMDLIEGLKVNFAKVIEVRNYRPRVVLLSQMAIFLLK